MEDDMVRMLAAILLFPLVASAAEGFQTPSGNIHCAIFGDELRCDIANRSFTPPSRLGSCQFDWGGSVALTPRGAALLCVSDSVVNPDHPVLAYGAAWQGKGMYCASSLAGLHCANAAGRGFELSRALLNLF
jgi:hypothetical protein